MKKILFIVNVDWFFVSHRLPIAIAAINDGWEVHVACALTEYRSFLEEKGIVVHQIDFSRGKAELVSEAGVIYSIFKLMRKIEPHIVHLITIKPVLYGGMVARVCGVAAVVASISGLGYVFVSSGARAGIRKGLVLLAYKMALRHRRARVIFQNPDDRKILVDAGAVYEASSVIIRGSGVNLDDYEFIPEPVQTPVVVLLSRMLRDKGVVEFIGAAQKIKKKGAVARFLLVGDTDENPSSISKHEIEEWVDSGVVEWLGYRNDISKILMGANLVVLPSYREGLPKALIEAAACGRAVVTTDVPGCRDAIEAGKTGLLVPPRNSEALADAILTLLEDEGLRKEYGRNGRKLAERCFSIESVIDVHLSIYEEMRS